MQTTKNKIGIIDFLETSDKTKYLIDELRDLSSEAEHIPISKLDKKLEEVSSLIIIPKATYGLLPNELDKLKEFILNGGNVLFLIGLETKNLFNDSLKILFDWLAVTPRFIKIDNEEEIKIMIFKEHPVTNNLPSFLLVNGVSFITSPKNDIIATTNHDNLIANTPIIIVGKKGSGKFIMIGSQRSFEQEYLKFKPNKQLLFNALCWLMDLKDCPDLGITIQPKVKHPQKEEQPKEKPTEEKIEEIEPLVVPSPTLKKEERKRQEEEKKLTVESTTPNLEIEKKRGMGAEVEEKKEKLLENLETLLPDMIEKLITSKILEIKKTLDEISKAQSEINKLSENVKKLNELPEKFVTFADNLDKYLRNQDKILNMLEKIQTELSNIEIDILEALRDYTNTASELLKKIDRIEASVNEKIEKILRQLGKR